MMNNFWRYYIIWFAMHIVVLIKGSDGIFHFDNMGLHEFWPFGINVSIHQYDISEFAVYTGIPLVIGLVFRASQRDVNDYLPKSSDLNTEENTKGINARLLGFLMVVILLSVAYIFAHYFVA